MKYGLYYFKNTKVLGDDFWAYAQSLFYPRIDYLIDNTTIYNFKSKDNEKVATIVSAFVEPLNYEYAFMPPSNIVPFFVGSYFRSTMWEYIENDCVLKYLKSVGPIGCRSKSNVKKLQSHGIDAYFTGCITLTLPKVDKKKLTSKYICCVDVPDYVVDYVKKSVGDNFEVRRMSHEIWTWSEEEQKRYSELSIYERFEKIKRYIEIYANAYCVVTSKLHCAMPCLTQDTPVLLTVPEDGYGVFDMQDRMGDFFELFHLAYYSDFIDGTVKYDFLNPCENKDNWKFFRADIEEAVRLFIKKCEEGLYDDDVVSVPDKERLENLVDILENKIIQLKNVVDSKNYQINELNEKLRKSEAVGGGRHSCKTAT
jgi:hypothetical protein